MAARDVFQWKLEGLQALDRMLAELPKALAKTVLRNALKKAAVPTRDAMIANAPQGPTHNLANSVEISTRLKASQRKFESLSKAWVTVYVGFTAPHAHLVEFGTVKRGYMTKGGVWHNTGHMPANPFARTAWEATRAQALEILGRELWNEILKAVKRLRRRAERGTLGKRQIQALME